MRAPMLFALTALVVAQACGGEVQQPSNEHVGAGGSAGSVHSGGSAGSAGIAKAGGAGGSAGQSSWTACTQPGTCELAPRDGCCGSCTPTLQDVVAVHYEHTQEYRKSTCEGWPVMCEPCMEPPAWNLAAFCEAGECVAIDVPSHAVSACTTTDDCMLQVAGCCPTCNPLVHQVVALNKAQAASYHAQMCNPFHDYACPGCIPQFPPGLGVACIAGHCGLVTPAQ